MVSLRRAFVAGAATLLLASACTSISNTPTIPPVNIPTIPPINLPSIPPINLPGTSGGGIGLPGFTLPPIIIPGLSIPPGSTPCTLISAAEVAQVMGGGVTDTSDTATNCTFVAANFSTVSVEATDDTDLSGVTFLMGSSAQQSTIAGFPALTGAVLGQPAVYVQKPSGQLQVLGILTGSDAATVTKLQQIAAIAVARMP